MAALGRLVITLSANIAEFAGALDKASFIADQRARAIQRALAGGMAMAAKAVAAAAVIIVGAIKKAVDYAGELSDLSESIGMNVESFQAFAAATAQSGVSTEDFRNGMVKLAQAVADNDPAFAAMGISLRDANGNLKSTEEVLLAVSDKFRRYQDGIGETALATDIFGKSGAKLIPVLNQGGSKLQEFAESAKDAGLVLSEDAVKAVDDLGDRLGALKTQVLVLAGNFTFGLIKALEGVGKAFSISLGKAESWQKAGEVLGAFIKNLIAGFVAVAGAAEYSAKKIGGYAIALTQFFAGNFSEASKIIEETNANATSAIQKAMEKTRVILSGSTASIVSDQEAALAESKRIADEAAAAADTEIAPNTKRFTDSQKEAAGKAKELAGIIKQVDEAYRSLAFTQDEIIIQNARLAGASDEVIADLEQKMLATTLLRNQQEMEKETNEKINETMKEQKALVASLPDMYYEVASASEKYAIDLKKILDMEQALIVAGAEYARIQEWKAAALDDLTKKYSPAAKAAADLAQVIASSFEDAIISGRSLSDVLKALADDILRIILRATITAPLQKGLTDALSGVGGSIFSSFLGFLGFGGAAGVSAPASSSVPWVSPSNISGARAAGGPVSAGRNYLVGEQGPEIFMPFNSGQIISNDRLSAERRSPIVRQVFNITTPNADSFRLSQRQIARRARGFVAA